MAERKRIAPRKKITAAEQEELLARLQQQDVKTQKQPIKEAAKPAARAKKVPMKTQRVTVDFPQEMYEEMKELTRMNGQTLRGFVVSLVRNHLKENQ